jgi:drug/metabolite transporter (DMT)-like permease
MLVEPPASGAVRWQALGALAFLGLGGTGLAYVLLAKGMQRLAAATVGLVSSTLPLFTMTEAHLLVGERITPYLLAGAAFVVTGAVLIVQHQRAYGRA